MPAAKIAWAFILLFILTLLNACSPSEPASVQSLARTGLQTPTPVQLVYQTATPSVTPTAGITPTMTPNEDPDYYYGGMVITMDDAGRTILLKKRQNFLLSLGKSYVWEVSVEPGDIISSNPNITPEPGDQGIFIARNRGKAVLKAVGNPLCRYTSPACARPSILFQIEVQVE